MAAIVLLLGRQCDDEGQNCHVAFSWSGVPLALGMLTAAYLDSQVVLSLPGRELSTRLRVPQSLKVPIAHSVIISKNKLSSRFVDFGGRESVVLGSSDVFTTASVL